MVTIDFDKNKENEAVVTFDGIVMTEDQREIVEMLIEIARKYIPLSKKALGLFAYESIGEWQRETGKLLKDLKASDVSERIESVATILNKIKERLINILVIADEKDKVEKGIRDALSYYKEKYAER